jgi:tetrahydromethanopterin S-methyltransferase subunit C
MPHIKHATIGALVASLVGAVMGFLLWARQLDYHGPNRHAMRVIGLMGLGLVTVAVAVACLSIGFLQYLSAREREDASVAASKRLARSEV